MAFSGHNQTLYNAALNGALCGMVSGRSIADPTTADYAGYGAAATAFATEVDTLIAADATITAAGATIVPGTAAQQANAVAKSEMMLALCKGVWEGRAGSDVTVADYALLANAVVAVYNEAIAQYALAPGGTSLS
jgi:uncharacterized protein YyaL (SSP411 family)